MADIIEILALALVGLAVCAIILSFVMPREREAKPKTRAPTDLRIVDERAKDKGD